MSTIKSSAENLTLNADGANNDVIIQSNGSTKVTVDGQNSRVGIGTTSPTQPLHVAGNIYTTGYLNTAGSGTAGGVQFADGNLYMYRATNDLAVKLQGAEKLRIQSGGGISFNGDTAAANALDDYEEGSWTPGMNNYGGTINVQTGTYVIIGGMCYFSLALGFSGADSSPVSITLPVTSKNLGTQTGGGYMTYNDYVSGPSNLEQMMPYVGSNSSVLNVFVNNNTNQIYNGFGAANGQCYYYFSGQYQV